MHSDPDDSTVADRQRVKRVGRKATNPTEPRLGDGTDARDRADGVQFGVRNLGQLRRTKN